MGNRGIITIENEYGTTHPVALYLHWNGGLESILAFMQYTWDTFDRGHDDMFTFHARLCQVIGNFFPEGLSLYGLKLDAAERWNADNGVFHFRLGRLGFSLPGRDADVERARQHRYWTGGDETIYQLIRRTMPPGTPGMPATQPEVVS